MGDRISGNPELIAWCRGQGGDWRLRLKHDLRVFEDGGNTTLAECLRRGEHRLSGTGLTEKRVLINVVMVHQPGHPEPWIMALALYWAVSTGMWDAANRPTPAKKLPAQRPRTIGALVPPAGLADRWLRAVWRFQAIRRR